METGQEEVETERQENETQNDEENDVLVEKAYIYILQMGAIQKEQQRMTSGVYVERQGD